MAREPFSNIGCQTLLAEKGSYGGWLKQFIQGKLLKSVKKRYVVFQNKCLYIYADSNSKSETVCFPLTSYSVELSNDIKDEAWGFKLVSLEHDMVTYFFSASSKREREEWMDKLREEIRRRSGDFDNYDYTLDEENCGRTSRIMSSGEIPAYEPAIHITADEFVGPRLHKRPSGGRLVPDNNNEPPLETLDGKLSPELVGSRKILGGPPVLPKRPGVATKPLKGGIVKQNSEHLPSSVAKIDRRKMSAPPETSGLSEETKRPVAPPRPHLPPRPQSKGMITPITYQQRGEVTEVEKMFREAKQMRDLRKGRDISRGNKKAITHQKIMVDDGYDDDSDDSDPPYLECTNEEEELREKVRSLPRGEPDGTSSRSSFKEKEIEKDALPVSAVQTSLDRAGAEELLQGSIDGTYVIRRGKDVPRVLSVFFKIKIRHFKIFEEFDGSRLEQSHPAFQSDRELVQYYINHDLPSGGMRLSCPYR